MKPPVLGLVTWESLPNLAVGDRLLMEELRRSGVHAAPVIWSDPRVQWGDFERLVIRSCWDYHERHEEFLAWLRVTERLGVNVVNSPDVVRWNLHKRYLAEFAAVGLATPKTAYVDRGSPTTLSSILQSQGWRKAVVKPAISASATGTWCVEADEGIDETRFGGASGTADLLVQEFIPDVVRRGEWSLVFLGGRFSHAVLKRASPGEFRVQSDYGGTARLERPDPEMLVWSRDVTERIPGRWQYARVDAVVTREGFMLMELECIEPELFLGLDPEAPRRAARAFSDGLRES